MEGARVAAPGFYSRALGMELSGAADAMVRTHDGKQGGLGWGFGCEGWWHPAGAPKFGILGSCDAQTVAGVSTGHGGLVRASSGVVRLRSGARGLACTAAAGSRGNLPSHVA
jgi:hypothetical protein